jgi:hypothetical protein
MKTRRVKSFESFADQLKAQSPELVTVGGLKKLKSPGLQPVVLGDRVGLFEYGLDYRVTTESRERRYRERVFGAFSGPRILAHSINDDPVRQAVSISLAAEQRAASLQLLLPDTVVHVVDASQQPLNEDAIRQLHEDAAQLEVCSALELRRV